MCGQEAGFRLMAWCFALRGLAGSAASTASREARLLQGIALAAERIEATLDYALSQRNNHGISEATALFTAGLLLDHPRAAAWRALGRRHLEEQARTLIDDDGAFSQHSVNYQRVMLHDYAWVLRLGDSVGRTLVPRVALRVGRAADFLYQLQDETTGRLPRYGQNDGALVLPLTNSEPGDFRSVIQSVRCLAYGTRTFAPGPWDEELFWLCGAEALSAPLDAPARTDLEAPSGGYYTLRAPGGFAFLRCGEIPPSPRSGRHAARGSALARREHRP